MGNLTSIYYRHNSDDLDHDVTVVANTSAIMAGPVTMPNLTVQGNLNIIGDLDVTNDTEVSGTLNIVG